MTSTNDPELDALLEESRAANPINASYLIHAHYRDSGVQQYDAERFRRLCAAWKEHPVEIAARIGMDKATLSKRLRSGGFGANGCYAECILLHQLERFIEWHLTGAERPTELFPPAKCLTQKSPVSAV